MKLHILGVWQNAKGNWLIGKQLKSAEIELRMKVFSYFDLAVSPQVIQLIDLAVAAPLLFEEVIFPAITAHKPASNYSAG